MAFGPPPIEQDTAQEIAASFISFFKTKKECGDLHLIDQLCQRALSGRKDIAQTATSCLFKEIIEPLCDDFSPSGVAITAKVLLRTLNYVVNEPQGVELKAILRQGGIKSIDDLEERFSRVRSTHKISSNQQAKARKFIILSRVTAGADIAITSVMVRRVRKSFPQAELVLIGPSHLNALFGNTDGCRIIPFIYKNDDNLIAKMTTWPTLATIIAKERQGYNADEILLFDPDSRLSQLGLLPLMEEESTFYFPSRSIGFGDIQQQNLSNLTNRWLNETLGENVPDTCPIFFRARDRKFSSFRQKLSLNGNKTVFTVNFGVGNDPQKKFNFNFETALLKELLKDEKAIVILDSGRGPSEIHATNRHLNKLIELGVSASTIAEGEKIDEISLHHGIIVHHGPLDNLGRLIRISDCFIGYDSCGQHIANAAGTPSVIIFAGAPSARFVARWSPNKQSGSTIPIFRHSKLGKRELDSLLKNVVEAVSQVRKSAII